MRIYNSNFIKIEAVVKGEKEFNIDDKIKVLDVSLSSQGDNYYNRGESDLFEEALINSAVINGSGFENVLNTNFIYNIAR